LRMLYLTLFPACMGIELTSGFDSQMINALQIVPSWVTCKKKTHTPLAHSLLTRRQISVTLKDLSRASSPQHTLLEPSCLCPLSPL
jgi:hypothetical protein